MPRRMLTRAVCVAGLVGAVLTLPGCTGGAIDKSGPAVSPQNMDAQKQQQYSDFMKNRGSSPGATPASAPGAPGTPGTAPGAPGGSKVPAPPHG